MKLAGKVCLIAGASGVIGAAIARQFRREGAHLALTCHSGKPEDLISGLPAGPSRVSCFPLEVSRWGEVQSTIEKVHARFHAVDVLVNCVGVLGPIGPTHQVDVQHWVRTIETNLIGCFFLVRAVLPIMLAQKGGKILLFSGGGAAYGRPYFTAYSASKAAVVRFTESLAEELGGANIQINAIAPGPVKSRMWDEMRRAGGQGGPRLLKELQQMDATGGVPPERAAALAVFLASDHSNGLTGRLISSVHDTWEEWESRIPKIMESDAGMLRRIPFD